MVEYELCVLTWACSYMQTTLGWRMHIEQEPLDNALVLSNFCKYHHCNISLKARFFGLHICRRHYRSIFNHFNVIGPESYRIR